MCYMLCVLEFLSSRKDNLISGWMVLSGCGAWKPSEEEPSLGAVEPSAVS